MREIEPPFDIEFEGHVLRVAEHELVNKRVFHIDFNGWKKPLVISVALNRTEEKFWTSIPEGRQNEAEVIGPLIAAYIREQRKNR